MRRFLSPGLVALNAVFVVTIFGLGGCSGEAESDSGIARVVCTTGMIADVARQVAGDRAEVVTLMGQGVDPHLYKPTRSDIDKIMSADLVFYNGISLEGKFSDVFVRAASGRLVFPVTELISESELLEPEQLKGYYDPHVWMDPVAWSSVVTVIRDKLIEFDPEGQSEYVANAADYAEKLEELDEYVRSAIDTVSDDRRVLITAHDAFNYFGRRYAFEVVGIQGLSTESEAGVRDIENLVDMLVDRDIPAVFIESTVAQRNVQALADGARARGHDVIIGGSLFSDAMGKPGSHEGTYIGMIDHNVTIIVRALGGEVPERGMLGRLGS